METIESLIPANPVSNAQSLNDSMEYESAVEWSFPVGGDLTSLCCWIRNNRRGLSSVATGAGPWT